MKKIYQNILHIANTYDFKNQAIPNLKRYGFWTFLIRTIREVTKRRGNEIYDKKTLRGVKEKASAEITPLDIPIDYEIERQQAYSILSKRIAEIRTRRLANLRLNPKSIISITESEMDVHAGLLQFQSVMEPLVSIVIPVFNNIRFTIECLLSIQDCGGEIPYEIIIVDDGSTDRTQDLLSKVKNIVYIRNQENLGFVRTCNHGAEKARGKYIVFLNNDVQVMHDWLSELVKTFGDFPRVGAVGPKILYPNGRLQEAGSLINLDCSTNFIGLTDDPELPRYNYVREVDYCSGTCLMVETRIFHEVENFSEYLAPSYCEDVDLCIKLREKGLRVLYNPKSVIVHHLSVTSNKIDNSYKIQCVTRNQQRLSEKWQEHIDNLNRIRLIAFYLPQFHTIPENDRWWGKGFTEWTNVTKARPNFVGHFQPRLPSDLGFYDLRLVEVMEQQAELARRYGIYGFCYYYYWFAGKRLLEMPVERILGTNRPDFPFCLCWANENWTRRWDGRENEILMGQEHSDEHDHDVILDIISYMRHPNYIRVNGKPLFLIYRAGLFPDIKKTTDIWRDTCRKEGIGEIYLAMVESFEHSRTGEHPAKFGFDASVEFPPHGTSTKIPPPGKLLNPEYSGYVNDYRELIIEKMKRDLPGYGRFRTVITSWDNTARRQNDSHIFAYATPESYQAWLEAVIAQTYEQNFGDERIVFINAWNEWAEGAYLEPDQQFGHGYLEATRNALDNMVLKTR